MKVKNFILLFFIAALVLLSLTIVVSASEAADDVTDAAAAAETAETSKPSILTPEDEEKAKQSGKKFQFQTEVNRMMKLIINSLYKTKEIFLRELISNASDALDKIRFISLTKKDVLKDAPDLKIMIHADKERNVLTITDTGIGMTSKDLRDNLGTIAKSGTSEFLNAMDNKTADVGLIGQFGVGFYSVFLVADSVTVVSKHNDDKQHIWESTSESEDPRGNTLGRGTQINIHLKPEATEYLEEDKLKGLVRKYSEFINFPIYLWVSKTKTEEIPDPSAVEEEDKKNDSMEEQDGDVEDAPEESAEKEKKPKTKTITKKYQDWEKMNENKPIWIRSPKKVTETEYKEFYRAFTKETKDPMNWIHFKAEGEVDFRSILYIPSKSPSGFLTKSEEITRNIKLFVRRVFITDELADFLPRYLGFLRGLVDSDDLPLNVSRETLQQSAILRLIKKKIIGKAMEMFKKMSENEEEWDKFIREYGIALKLGITEDNANRKKLSKLVRFRSSFSDTKLTSLDDYVKRMKKNQPQIYVCTGNDINEIKRSPFLEKLLGRGYEVLYMTDPIDEYVITTLTEYEGKKLHPISKAGLKYGDEDEQSNEEEDRLAEKFKSLTDYIKSNLDEHVGDVVISNKLTKSPCAIVAPEHGISGNMEKMMAAQNLGAEDYMAQYYRRQKKIFEINPSHPIIESLLEKVESGKEDDTLRQTVHVLFEATLLRSGFNVPNTNDFAARIERVIRDSLGVDQDLEADVELKPAPEAEKPKSSKQDSEDKESEHDEL